MCKAWWLTKLTQTDPDSGKIAVVIILRELITFGTCKHLRIWKLNLLKLNSFEILRSLNKAIDQSLLARQHFIGHFDFKNTYWKLFAVRRHFVVYVKHFFNQSHVVVNADVRIKLVTCVDYVRLFVSLTSASWISSVFKFSNKFGFRPCF